MVQLSCDCLNVKINVGETDLSSSSPDISSDYGGCDFFCGELLEAKISPSAIVQEHTYLVHKVQVKDWLVHRCVNCGVYTHAVPSESNRKGVLVSKTLQSDPDAQDRLTRSSDYSPLFRVVLRGQDPTMSPSLPITEDSNSAFQTLQTYVSRIQQQLNSFLLQEEAHMEERVRAFQDEQRDIFSELEARVKNDKKKMISVLFNNMQTSSDDSSVSVNGNRPVLRSTKSVPMATAVNHNPRHKGQERRSENTVSRPRSLRPYDQIPDNEVMFMLDDDEDEDTPFSVSDEEDTDDSIQMDDARRSSGNLNSVFSTSVPISVPLWKPRSPRRAEHDDDEVRAPAPDQMAASMQALARSVHNNDVTNLFGELPRPRLSTFSGELRK